MVTGLSPSTLRFPIPALNLTIATILLAFGQSAIAAAVFNPPADRFACPLRSPALMRL
jgi:hypothetical protein